MANPKNGNRLLVIVGVAAAIAIGGSYTLGFTHAHTEYVEISDLTEIKIQLAEINVKMDLMLDAHDITMTDDLGPTSPR